MGDKKVSQAAMRNKAFKNKFYCIARAAGKRTDIEMSAGRHS